MERNIITGKIYLLIGPKGSGKSFIGNLLEREFGIRFIRVEDRVKDIRKDRQIDDLSYIQEVFKEIEAMVRESAILHGNIVFESTGLTVSFDRMLKNLKKDFKVITIEIKADDDLCLERVRSRDQSIHVNVSDDELLLINKMVKDKKFIPDHTLTNNSKTEEELIKEIDEII